MKQTKKDQPDVLAAVANLAKYVEALTDKVETLATAGAPAEILGLKRSIGELAGRFANMAPIMSAAINERERERQALVMELYKRGVPFTPGELECKPLDDLRTLRDMTEACNFARGDVIAQLTARLLTKQAHGKRKQSHRKRSTNNGRTQ